MYVIKIKAVNCFRSDELAGVVLDDILGEPNIIQMLSARTERSGLFSKDRKARINQQGQTGQDKSARTERPG